MRTRVWCIAGVLLACLGSSFGGPVNAQADPRVLGHHFLPSPTDPRTPPPPPGQWPLTGSSPPTVMRAFDAPYPDWLPGHRGVDLAGHAGQSVHAAAGGRVTYAGALAGRGVVVVSHGATRTTYEPVGATVRVGDQVRAGDQIGWLEAGHCAPNDCLHWGLRSAERYLDPLTMLTQGDPSADQVRLLPGSAVDEARSNAAHRAETAALADTIPIFSGVIPGAVGSTRPADGPITSPFGMRRHPITGIYKLHDGVDIGATCGSPIRAARAGRVVQVMPHRAYGWWLIIDHGLVNGRRLRTGYAHASGYLARQGQQVVAGQHLGAVGTTGWSTGCHLHFMVWVDGKITNPTSMLG